MKKILTLSAVALAMTVMSGASFAKQGGEGNNTNCEGRGNPNSPCQPSTPPSSGGGGGSTNVDVNVYNKAYGGNATGGSVTGSGNSTVGPVGSVGDVSGSGNTVKSLSPEAKASASSSSTNVQLQGQVNDQKNTQVVTVDADDNKYTVKAAKIAADAQVKAAEIAAGANRGRDLTEVQIATINADAAVAAARAGRVNNTPNVDGPPLTSSNDTCMGSSSGSLNLPGFGIGGGTTWVDENCKMLKNSRELWNMGMKAAALALMCNDAKNREALEVTGYACPPLKGAGSSTNGAGARAPDRPGLAMHEGG